MKSKIKSEMAELDSATEVNTSINLQKCDSMEKNETIINDDDENSMRIIMLSVDSLKEHPLHEKIYKDSIKTCKDILETIEKECDLIQPVVINTSYQILCGLRRVNAFREQGIKRIPVILRRDLSREKEEEIILDSNRYRSKSAIELVREIQYYYAIYKRNPGRKSNKNCNNPDAITGKTKNFVAALVGYSPTMVDALSKIDLNSVTQRGVLKMVDNDETTLTGAIKQINDFLKRGDNKNDKQNDKKHVDSELNDEQKTISSDINYKNELSDNKVIKKELNRCNVNPIDSTLIENGTGQKIRELISTLLGSDIPISTNQIFTCTTIGGSHPSYVLVKIETDTANCNNLKI